MRQTRGAGACAALLAALLASACTAAPTAGSSTLADPAVGSPVSVAVPSAPIVARRGVDGSCYLPVATDMSTPRGLVFVDPAPNAVVLEWLPGLDDRACSAVLVRRSQSSARQLAALVDAAPASPTGPTACPADFGTAVLLVFLFPSPRAEQATVELTGCRGIDALGRLRRTLPDTLTAALLPGAPAPWRARL